MRRTSCVVAVVVSLFMASCVGQPPGDDDDVVVDAGANSPDAADDQTDPDAGTDEACGWVRAVDLGGESLNIRSETSLGSDVVGTLSEGMKVAVLEVATGDVVTDDGLGRSSDEWYRVDAPTGTGWVTAVYLECTEAPVTGTCGQTLPTTWLWPTPGNNRIVQAYGNPIQYQSCGFHTGLDISGATGDPLIAIGDGEVVHVGPMWLSGAGQGRGEFTVILHHGDNVYSTYGHNDVARVEVGDCVNAGDLIADLGNEGYSSGPHLHFEIVTGTPFTGDWMTPFADACTHYVNPSDYVTP